MVAAEDLKQPDGLLSHKLALEAEQQPAVAVHHLSGVNGDEMLPQVGRHDPNQLLKRSWRGGGGRGGECAFVCGCVCARKYV